MLRAHRQAWAWQDEWVELTMDDIRKLEDEAKHYLSNIMSSKSNEDSPINKKTDLIIYEKNESTELEEKEEDDESEDIFFDCFEPSVNLITQKNNKHTQMVCWSSELLLMNSKTENREKVKPLSDISSSNYNNRALLVLVFHGDIFPTVIIF